MNTKDDNTEIMPTPAQQQTVGAGDQLSNTVGHSPFARPGSWAGASTVPATSTEMPFIRPARQPHWIGMIRRRLSQGSPTSYKTLKL